MAGERFLGNESPLPDFIVAIGETAAGKTDTDIGVLAERAADPEFGIDISGGDGEPQRQVGRIEVGVIAVVKCVTGDRWMALKRRVVAELNEFARVGINLGKRVIGAQTAPQEKTSRPSLDTMHAPFLTKTE